jgi:hypothetical protein
MAQKPNTNQVRPMFTSREFVQRLYQGRRARQDPCAGSRYGQPRREQSGKQECPPWKTTTIDFCVLCVPLPCHGVPSLVHGSSTADASRAKEDGDARVGSL